MREFKLAATLRDEGNTPASIEHLRKALELDSENGRAHVLMGFIFMERQDFTTAIEHLRRGVSVLEAQGGHGSSVAEAKNLLGLAYVQTERYAEAVNTLRASASDLLNTAPHLAWGNLGLAYYESGEYSSALEALNQAVKIQPRFCVGYYRIGQTHFARKEFAEAEKALDKALSVDELCADRYQEAWQLRGEVRARLGHREDAISDFERCVELGSETEAGQSCRRLLSVE